MKVDDHTIEALLSISKLKLTEEERSSMLIDLKSILDAFIAIQDVNVANVNSAILPIKLENCVRMDEAKIFEGSAISPARYVVDNFILGPRTLE